MNLAVWGANSYGQLGIGIKSELLAEPTFLEPSRLKDLPPLKDISSVCGGGGHTLILTNDGEVYGCGWNKSGQLLGKECCELDFIKLTQIQEYKVIQLSTQWDSCFAVTETGDCLGWGSNAFGQLGLPRNKVSPKIPSILLRDVKQVECGARHSVILSKHGTVLTAGDKKFGKLGRGDQDLSPGFKTVQSLKNVKQIACGFNHNIAISEDNKIFLWGCNKWGQLGKDPRSRAYIEFPEELTVLQGDILSVFAGWSSSHFLTKDGRLLSFGRNNYGQLGQKDCTTKPWDIHVLQNIHSISVGAEHALALTSEQKLISWGWNEHGSCGNGSVQDQYIPSEIKIDKSFTVLKFSAASGHNYAILGSDLQS